jgi:Trk K+ transport system NAD-binding subunit
MSNRGSANGHGLPPFRRLRAELLYLVWAVQVLARPLVMMVIVVALGAIVERFYGHDAGAPPPTWSYAFFVSYCLLFLEHIEPTPEHPLAQLVHYGLPLVGVILVSEGLLRLGVNLLNRDSSTRNWVSIMAATTRGHVILCGVGSVGLRIVEELHEMGVEVFAVEKNPDGMWIERARTLGAHVLVGDGRAENLLEELNVRTARAVIIATDDDLANLEIAMDVRELRKDVPIVMRLFDQRLAQKVKATLGIEVSVSTSRLAAPLFASAALDPAVVGTHRVGDTTLVVVQLVLARGAVLRGQRIADLADQGLTVVAIRTPDGGWEVPPKPDRMCAEGDRVQVLVPTGRIEEVHALAAG